MPLVAVAAVMPLRENLPDENHALATVPANAPAAPMVAAVAPVPTSAAVAEVSEAVPPATAAAGSTSAATSAAAPQTVDPPRLVSGTSSTPWPEYPPLARGRGWEGTALVGLLVSAEGELMDVRLLTSSGRAVLDRAALAALGRWRLPAAPEAEPQWFEVPVRFALR